MYTYFQSQPTPQGCKVYIINQNNSNSQTIAYLVEDEKIVLRLQKQSSNTGISNNNGCYSLAGAVYGIYTDAACTKKVGEVTTNANGFNKLFCKLRGIRLSGKALGRKNEVQKEAEKQQMYRDSCERNWVEGKNGLLKTRYGMSRVMSKLDGSAKTDLVFAILAMNAFRKLREELPISRMIPTRKL